MKLKDRAGPGRNGPGYWPSPDCAAEQRCPGASFWCGKGSRRMQLSGWGAEDWDAAGSGKVNFQPSHGAGVPSYQLTVAGRTAPPQPQLFFPRSKAGPIGQLSSLPVWESFLLLCSVPDELSCVRPQVAWRQAGWLASQVFCGCIVHPPPGISPQTREDAGSKGGDPRRSVPRDSQTAQR